MTEVISNVADIGSRYQPQSCVAPTIMPSEAALNLSLLDLLQAFNEKLSLECTRIQVTRLPHGVSVTALKTEVSVSSITELRQDLKI